MGLQIQSDFSYDRWVAKKKDAVTRKTTDKALVVAMRALVRVVEGQEMPQLIAQTALAEIGDPKELIGVDSILGPVEQGRVPLFDSILDTLVAARDQRTK